MFRKGTVFIIGAGANCEIGLPAGDGLRSHIIDAFTTVSTSPQRIFANDAVQDAIALKTENQADAYAWINAMRDYAGLAKRFADGLPLAYSIDNYLDAHQSNEELVFIGKLGIAAAILKAESASAVAIRPNGTWNQMLKQSWYFPFMSLLTLGRPLEQLDMLFENVSFIVFNYDRCLEMFLLQAISAYYFVDSDRAREVLSTVKIVHPYGQVGGLPLLPGEPPVPFGTTENIDLLGVAGNIKTFTEAVDRGITADVKMMVQRADTLVFMGFGFLDQNMKLLTPKGNGGTQTRRVFATTYGISATDTDVVIERVGRMIKGTRTSLDDLNYYHADHLQYPRYIEHGTCNDLMKNNWFQLQND